MNRVNGSPAGSVAAGVTEHETGDYPTRPGDVKKIFTGARRHLTVYSSMGTPTTLPHSVHEPS